MLLEYGVVLMMVVVFLISLCSFISKLRLHYEEQQEIAQQNVQKMTGQVNYAIDQNEGGVYPASLDPPPYSECILPPKYEEIDEKKIDLAKVHQHDPSILLDPKAIFSTQLVINK